MSNVLAREYNLEDRLRGQAGRTATKVVNNGLSGEFYDHQVNSDLQAVYRRSTLYDFYMWCLSRSEADTDETIERKERCMALFDKVDNELESEFRDFM